MLSDEDMKKLANFIHLNRTPVIISESINWVDQDYLSDSRDEFEKILWSWNKAFVEKNLKEIDSLYAEGAQIRGKKREDLHYKIKNLDFIKKHFVLQPRDIAILQEGDNAVIIFDQIFDVKDNNTFQGFYNKLVLEKINENWYVVDESSISEPADRRLATAKDTQKDAVSPEKIAEKNIRSLVRKWRASWESGSMKTYRACYASDFQSRNMGLDAWIAHKIKVRQKSSNIKISVNNLQISISGNTARATFVQQYSSSILRTKGSKTLELKKVPTDGKYIGKLCRDCCPLKPAALSIKKPVFYSTGFLIWLEKRRQSYFQYFVILLSCDTVLTFGTSRLRRHDGIAFLM